MAADLRRFLAETNWAARVEGQVIAIARDETCAVGFMSLAAQG
jgi:hypothetical protein